MKYFPNTSRARYRYLYVSSLLYVVVYFTNIYQLNMLYGTGCEMPQGFGTKTFERPMKEVAVACFKVVTRNRRGKVQSRYAALWPIFKTRLPNFDLQLDAEIDQRNGAKVT